MDILWLLDKAFYFSRKNNMPICGKYDMIPRYICRVFSKLVRYYYYNHEKRFQSLACTFKAALNNTFFRPIN